LRRIRRFAGQLALVGVLAAGGVLTAGALAGGVSTHNTTTKTGHGDHHNTGMDETTTAAPEATEAPSLPASTQTPSPPIDPTKAVTTTNFGTDPAKASAKAEARAELSWTTAVMAMMCSGALLIDLAATGETSPEAIFTLWWYRFACSQAIAQVFALNAILKADPPDTNIAEVAFPAQTPLPAMRVLCAKTLTRATCARVTTGAVAYAKALATTSAAAAGLVASVNRFGSATTAGSADGRLLQAGAAKAYAGELANALNAQHQAGRALAAVLRATRSDRGLDTRARAAASKKLASPGSLPTWLTTSAAASGLVPSAAELRKTLAAALARVPKSLSVAAAVAAGSPSAGLTQLQHSLTVYELAAVVRALAKQGAIAQGTGETLLTDLRAALTATTPAERAAAVALFAQNATVAQPAPAALLSAAAHALS
jgi:hypothetical protein